MDNTEVVEKVVGTYKNRIAPYLEPDKTPGSGNIINNATHNSTKDPTPTCENCKYQKDDYCNRYPQRYIVKSQAGYLPACGEFKPS